MRNLPLAHGLAVPSGGDPIAAAARLRYQLKGSGDERSAVQLRAFLNSLSAGIFGRLDQHRLSVGRGGHSRLVETPAPWTWPPIAATVSAVPRMWLAMVERLFTDRGGTIICRDTDGMVVLASPDGASMTSTDGRTVRVASWSEVDEILALFDPLDPFDDGGPFWKIERGIDGRPLHLLSLGRKRYVKAVQT